SGCPSAGARRSSHPGSIAARKGADCAHCGTDAVSGPCHPARSALLNIINDAERILPAATYGDARDAERLTHLRGAGDPTQTSFAKPGLELWLESIAYPDPEYLLV